MPFSFLNPLFWIGALAVGAPLWLHLRQRQERQLVRFSALRFLEDQPSAQRSPLRLRHWLLFALRTLAVLLIVGGFAWPYLRGANTVPVRESRVYILDNTLSQQAGGRFLQDRNRLVKEISSAGPDLQVAVVELGSVPRLLAGFTEARQSALAAIRALKPSFERGSYLAAFRQANTLLANSLGQHKRIILLGDNQANQWNENVNTPPFLRDIEVDLPRTETAALPNLWLSEPRVQRIFLGDKSLVNLSLKVSHAGPARAAKLMVQANGQTVHTRTVQLEGQPETMLLHAQWEAEPGQWVQGQASLEGEPDSLAADNRLFFTLPPVQEGKVALLARSAYLRLALSAEIMRGQWATRVLELGGLASELASEHDADVLCLESSFLQSAEARKLLWRYLNAGRGVFLVLDQVTPAGEACLREMGFEVEGQARTSDHPDKVQFVFSNHPIFHPFLSPDFGNLMEIRVSRYTRLRAAQAMPLMFSETGAGLFFESSKYRGKLFVTAFGFDRASTSWPLHPTFIPFLDLALQSARGQDAAPVDFEPGASATLQLAAGATNHDIVLRGPDGAEVVRAEVEQGRAQWHMPGQPGLYTLSYDGGQQVEKIFSVNPSAKESELSYASAPVAAKAWHLADSAKEPKSLGLLSGGQIRLSAALQQRCWWWMVLAGALGLLLETGIAAGTREVK